MRRPSTHLAALLLCAPLVAGAAIQTERVEYRDGDTVLTGYLSYDDAIEANAPECSSFMNGGA